MPLSLGELFFQIGAKTDRLKDAEAALQRTAQVAEQTAQRANAAATKATTGAASSATAAASALRQMSQAAASGVAPVAALAQAVTASARSFQTLSQVATGLGIATGLTAAVAVAKELATEGIRYNAVLEQQVIGIGSIINATNEIRDAQGRTLVGAEKFNAAQEIASGLMRQIQQDALQTTATAEQLVDAFQQAIGPLSAAGLSLDQSREATLRIVQAASALGVPMHQVAQEVRAIAEGSIDVNARLAKALGITNDQVKAAAEQGRLFQFITKETEAFAAAGQKTAQSFSGLTSSIADVSSQIAGKAFSGPFEALKNVLSGVFDGLQQVNSALEENATRALLAEEAARRHADAQSPGFFSQVADVLQNLASILGGQLVQGLTLAWEGTKNLLATLQDFLSIAGNIVGLGSLWTFFTAGANALLEGKNAFEAIKQAGTDAASSIQQAGSDIGARLTGFGQEVNLFAEGLIYTGDIADVTWRKIDEGAVLAQSAIVSLSQVTQEYTTTTNAASVATEKLAQAQGKARDAATAQIPELEAVNRVLRKAVEDQADLATALNLVEQTKLLVKTGDVNATATITKLKDENEQYTNVIRERGKADTQAATAQREASQVASETAQAVDRLAASQQKLAQITAQATGSFSGLEQAGLSALQAERDKQLAAATGNAAARVAIEKNYQAQVKLLYIDLTDTYISELEKQTSAVERAINTQSSVNEKYFQAQDTARESEASSIQAQLDLQDALKRPLEERIPLIERLTELEIQSAREAQARIAQQIAEEEGRIALTQEAIRALQQRIAVEEKTGNVAQAALLTEALGKQNDALLQQTATVTTLRAGYAAAGQEAQNAAVQGKVAFAQLNQEITQTALLTTNDVRDALKEIGTGLLQGTQDIGSIFSDLGKGLGTKLFDGILFGKEEHLDQPLIGNINSLVGGSGGGILGSIFSSAGSTLMGQLGGSLQGASGILNNALTDLGDLSQVSWQSIGTSSANIFGNSLFGGINSFLTGNLPFLGNIASLGTTIGSTLGGSLTSFLGGGALSSTLGSSVSSLIAGAFSPIGIGLALASAIPSIISLFSQPGRIQLEKKAAKSFFEEVFDQDFKIFKEKDVASATAQFENLVPAVQALGSAFSTDLDNATQGTIVRFNQFLANLQDMGVGADEAKAKVLELAQAMGFSLPTAIEEINKQTSGGILSLGEFKEEIGEARKNLKEYADTSTLTAEQLTELARANGNTGSQLVTYQGLLEGVLDVATGFNEAIDSGALVAELLANKFGEVATAAGAATTDIEALAEQIRGQTLSVEEAILQLQKLSGIKFDLGAFTLDPTALQAEIDKLIAQAVQQAANADLVGRGFADNLVSGIEEGLSVADAGAAFEDFMRRSLAQAAIEKVITDHLGPILQNIDITGPLTPETLAELRTEFERLYEFSQGIWESWGLVAEEVEDATEAAAKFPELSLADDMQKAAQAFEEMTEESKKWAGSLLEAQRALTGVTTGLAVPDLNVLAAEAEEIGNSITQDLFSGVTEAFTGGGIDGAIAQLGANLHATIMGNVQQALFDAISAQVVLPLLQPLITGMAFAGQQLVNKEIDAVAYAATIKGLLEGIDLSSIRDAMAAALTLAGEISATLEGMNIAPLAVAGSGSGRPSATLSGGVNAVAGGGGGGGGGSTGPNLFEDAADAVKKALDDLASFLNDQKAEAAGALTKSLVDLESSAQKIRDSLNEAVTKVFEANNLRSGSLSDTITRLESRADLSPFLERQLRPLIIELTTLQESFAELEAAAAAARQELVDNFVAELTSYVTDTADAGHELTDQFRELIGQVEENRAVLEEFGHNVETITRDLAQAFITRLLRPIDDAIGELATGVVQSLDQVLASVAAAGTLEQLEDASNAGIKAIQDRYAFERSQLEEQQDKLGQLIDLKNELIDLEQEHIQLQIDGLEQQQEVLEKQIDALEKSRSSVQEAKRLVEEELRAIEEQLRAVEQLRDAAKGLRDQARDAAFALLPLQQQGPALKKLIASLIPKAKAGDLGAVAELGQLTGQLQALGEQARQTAEQIRAGVRGLRAAVEQARFDRLTPQQQATTLKTNIQKTATLAKTGDIEALQQLPQLTSQLNQLGNQLIENAKSLRAVAAGFRDLVADMQFATLSTNEQAASLRQQIQQTQKLAKTGDEVALQKLPQLTEKLNQLGNQLIENAKHLRDTAAGFRQLVADMQFATLNTNEQADSLRRQIHETQKLAKTGDEVALQKLPELTNQLNQLGADLIENAKRLRDTAASFREIVAQMHFAELSADEQAASLRRQIHETQKLAKTGDEVALQKLPELTGRLTQMGEELIENAKSVREAAAGFRDLVAQMHFAELSADQQVSSLRQQIQQTQKLAKTGDEVALQKLPQLIEQLNQMGEELIASAKQARETAAGFRETVAQMRFARLSANEQINSLKTQIAATAALARTGDEVALQKLPQLTDALQGFGDQATDTAQSMRDAARSLRDTAAERTLSDQSFLLPEDRLNALKEQVIAVAAAAVGGDTEADQQLSEMTGQINDLARQLYASGDKAQEIFAFTQGILQNTAAQLDQAAAAQQQQAADINTLIETTLSETAAAAELAAQRQEARAQEFFTFTEQTLLETAAAAEKAAKKQEAQAQEFFQFTKGVLLSTALAAEVAAKKQEARAQEFFQFTKGVLLSTAQAAEVAAKKQEAQAKEFFQFTKGVLLSTALAAEVAAKKQEAQAKEFFQFTQKILLDTAAAAEKAAQKQEALANSYFQYTQKVLKETADAITKLANAQEADLKWQQKQQELELKSLALQEKDLDKQIGQLQTQIDSLETQKESLQTQIDQLEVQRGIHDHAKRTAEINAEIQRLTGELGLTGNESLDELQDMADNIPGKLDELKRQEIQDLLLLREKVKEQAEALLGIDGTITDSTRTLYDQTGRAAEHVALHIRAQTDSINHQIGFSAHHTILAINAVAAKIGTPAPPPSNPYPPGIFIPPGAVPHMATGGIVTGPTTALIGEAGPEAVIPLGEGGFDDIVSELRAQREELHQMKDLLSKEGFNFKFYGMSKEELANYTMNEFRKRASYGDFYVNGTRIVMGG